MMPEVLRSNRKALAWLMLQAGGWYQAIVWVIACRTWLGSVRVV